MYEKLKRKAITPNMQQQRRHLQIEPEHPMLASNARNDERMSKIGNPINSRSQIYMPFQKKTISTTASPSIIYPISNAPTTTNFNPTRVPLPTFNQRRLTHINRNP